MRSGSLLPCNIVSVATRARRTIEPRHIVTLSAGTTAPSGPSIGRHDRPVAGVRRACQPPVVAHESVQGLSQERRRGEVDRVKGTKVCRVHGRRPGQHPGVDPYELDAGEYPPWPRAAFGLRAA